jgi:hypothetical protein
MLLIRYVARSVKGRQDLNTLDIREDWELVKMLICEEEPEPVAWIEAEEVGEEEEDDWELVEINNVIFNDEEPR